MLVAVAASVPCLRRRLRLATPAAVVVVVAVVEATLVEVSRLQCERFVRAGRQPVSEQTAVSVWVYWSGRLATLFADVTHVQSMHCRALHDSP